MKQMISGQINQPVIIRYDTKEIQQIQKEIDSKQQILTINDIPVVSDMSTENVSVGDLTSISCLRVDTDNGEEQHRYDIPDIIGLKSAIDGIDIPDNTKIFYGVPLEMPPSSGKYVYYVSDNNTTQISHIYTAASIIELFNELKNIKIYISQFHDESETTKKIMLDLVQVVEVSNNPLCYFIGWLCSDEAPKQVFGTMSFYSIDIQIVDSPSGGGNIVETMRYDYGSLEYKLSHSFNQLSAMLSEGKTVVLPITTDSLTTQYMLVGTEQSGNRYYAYFQDGLYNQKQFVADSPLEVMHTESIR